MHGVRWQARLVFFVLTFISFSIFAKGTPLQDILAMTEAPEGVVIEIATSDNTGLRWALPKAQDYIKQLRERFPGLPISIVTHGREQFALTKKNQKENQAEHNAVQSLLKDNKVQLHVCGTYAGWRGLTEEDFPDYVDVAAEGPAQVNDYIAVGYVHTVIRAPKKKAN